MVKLCVFQLQNPVDHLLPKLIEIGMFGVDGVQPLFRLIGQLRLTFLTGGGRRERGTAVNHQILKIAHLPETALIAFVVATGDQHFAASVVNGLPGRPLLPQLLAFGFIHAVEENIAMTIDGFVLLESVCDRFNALAFDQNTWYI